MAIVGTIPNTITNGQVEDAAPVMANFNWIISQVNANAAALAAANSFTAVQSGVAAAAGANFPITSQVQNNAFNWGGTAGGTANALTLSPAVVVAAYTGGQIFWFKAGASDNSGAATVAISGLAAINIYANDAALVGGEIKAGCYYCIIVDDALTHCELGRVINAPSAEEVQLQTPTAFTTAGSATAFTLTPSPAIAANAKNIAFWVQFHTAAGATPTMAVSGKAALPVVYLDSTGTEQAITATQCPTGWRGLVVCNAAATKWVLYDIPRLIDAFATSAEIKTGTVSTKPAAPDAILAALGFSASFTSAAQTITAGGALTLAHGLPRVPVLLQGWLKCVSAELNYSVNDMVAIPLGALTTAANASVAVTPDATNLNVRFGNIAGVFPMIDKTTGGTSYITPAKWNLILSAWG